MEGLVEDPGQWREKGVVVLKGTEVKHIAPPANRVPFLMADLFSFLTQEIALTWLLKACIFHYELEFIHPFSDGNGRMGRLWQQLLLMKEAPIFQYIPIEVLIKEHQQEYYRVLGECDAAGDSTLFIEFSLEQIVTALMAYINTAVPNSVSDVNTRLEYAKSKGIAKWFSRKDYMQLHKDISSATASRDLQQGVDMGLLTKRGEKNQVQYQFLK
jgi:Fic family protein